MPEDDRIGVLHLISGLLPGGAERMLVWAARYHDRSRFRMGVVSLMSGGQFAAAIRESGVPVFELGQQRGRLSPAGLRRLLSTVRDFTPMILQGHLFHSNILSRLTGVFRRRLAVINTMHTGWEPVHRRFLYACTDFLVDGSITYGMPDDLPNIEADLPPSNHCRIPYGIAVPNGDRDDRAAARVRLGLPPEAAVWLAVGRLSPEKGFADLITALSRLGGNQNGPMVLIVGSGRQEPDLRRMIAGGELSDRVILAGYQSDLTDYFAAADYFVLPSRWEAGPLVVLEAMSAGLPVVATDVGRVRSMVKDGGTGFVVPPSEPEELARAMERLMALGDAGHDWGKRGRDRITEHYDFVRTQRETERFYSEVLRRTGQRGGGP